MSIIQYYDINKQQKYCKLCIQTHFLKWKCIDLDKNFTDIYFQESNW